MLTGDILRLSAERHPKRIALICGETRISYQDLYASANKFSNTLLNLKIGKGACWAIMSQNLPEYIIAHFGSAQTGARMVNLQPSYTPDDLVKILNLADARLIIVEEIFQENIAKIEGLIPTLESVIVIGKPIIDEWISFDQFIRGQSATPPLSDLDEDDIFAMTFTGGTTGMPKGTLVSHRARFASCYTTVIEHGVTGSDIVGMVTPFYHAMGSLVWLPTVMFVGATAVLMSSWDPNHFIQQTAKHGITCTFMVPVQLRQVLSDVNFNIDNLKSLKNIACGGAISPADLIIEINEKLPNAKFTNHYGQSETGPICIYSHYHPRTKADTVGRPAVGVDLKIVDSEGQEVPDGKSGEIICRGPFLMSGYHKNEQETQIYFKTGDGWGWTGDLAKKDPDGFITLVGRSKDMIVSGGVNIYPREVEIVLEQHKEIIDCTVFGIPDEYWGEALVAYVVPREKEELTEKVINNHCIEHLARFKRPKYIKIVNSITKTPSGKVQKPALRNAFLKDHKIS